MFLGLFSFFPGYFFDVGFEGILLSSCTSLPTAAVGLSILGFLGVCLVQAIVPIDYNEKPLSIRFMFK